MTATVSLTVPGSLEQVPCIRHWLQTALTEWQIAAEVITELVLVITEVCTNIIRHGYSNVCQGDIEIIVTRSPQTIQLIVLDRAPVFAPPQVDSPPPETLAEGGYGLFLIQTLTDEVVHERRDGQGNCLRLAKHLPPGIIASS